MLVCCLTIPKIDRLGVEAKKPLSQADNYVTIYTDKYEYSIFDSVFVTFEYISDSEYQYYYAITNNPNELQSVIWQSDAYQGVGDKISENYTFRLSECAIQVPNKGKKYYIALVQKGFLNIDIIGSKDIFIKKETLNCFIFNNNTIIEYPNVFNFTFYLLSNENQSHYFQENTIKCLITSDNNISYETYAIKTNNEGEYSILYSSQDNNISNQNVTIIIIIRENPQYDDINFTINFSVIRTHKDILYSVVSIGIILPVILIIIYKKKNQVYVLNDIKL